MHFIQNNIKIKKSKKNSNGCKLYENGFSIHKKRNYSILCMCYRCMLLETNTENWGEMLKNIVKRKKKKKLNVCGLEMV